MRKWWKEYTRWCTKHWKYLYLVKKYGVCRQGAYQPNLHTGFDSQVNTISNENASALLCRSIFVAAAFFNYLQYLHTWVCNLAYKSSAICIHAHEHCAIWIRIWSWCSIYFRSLFRLFQTDFVVAYSIIFITLCLNWFNVNMNTFNCVLLLNGWREAFSFLLLTNIPRVAVRCYALCNPSNLF